VGDTLKSYRRGLIGVLLLATTVVGSQAFATDSATSVVTAESSSLVQPEQSILERFRLYKGERTVEDFSSLFIVADSTVVRQQPRIALSDGSTAMILAIKLAAIDGVAPNFTLRNATLVNLQQKANNEWVLKALPAKGALDTALIVAAGATVKEFPVVVSPILPPEWNPTLSAFKDFLSNSEKGCTKEKDINADGVCDYRDDYIYTANYLYNESTSGRSKDARRQRALQRTLLTPPAKAIDPTSGVVTDPNFQP
jgi:hypothetical protein